MRVAVFFFALVLAGAPAWAQDAIGFYDGNQLYERCMDTDMSLWCLGYVAATADFTQVTLPSHSDAMIVCIREGMTLQQLADVVRNYLRNHPEQRHWPASALVTIALGEAFPCG